MSSITHAAVRAARRWPVAVRGLLVLCLSALLSVGMVAMTPTTASAVTEVRASLPGAVDASGPLAAFGANVVLGTHRSTNTGGTWALDSTLTDTSITWSAAVNGTLIGYRPSGSAYQAVIFTIATGTTQTWALPTLPSAGMSTTWALLTDGGSAHDFTTGQELKASPPSTTGLTTAPTAAIGPTGALVWQGATTSSHTVFSVATSPAATPSAWVTIDGVVKKIITATQLLYVVNTGAFVQVCARSFATFTTAACSTVVSGANAQFVNSFANFGATSLVEVADEGTGKVTSYLWNGSSVVTVQVPVGSWIDQPTDVASHGLYGDTAFVLVRDASSVPSVKKVAADGSLSSGFALPTKASATVTNLAVAPGRVVGTDDRDASSQIFPAWSRSVAALGTETLLPKRASAVAASAARTAVSSSDGLTLYDRGGALTHTFSDAHLDEVSGPYVTQNLWDPTFTQYVLVSRADGTEVARVSAADGMLFGSLFITATANAATGSMRLVVKDLTGKAADRTVDLAAGSSGCTNLTVWNDTVGATCDSGHTVRVYSLVTGAMTSTQGSVSGPFMLLTELGDGYAIVYKNGEALVWDIAGGSLTTLLECLGWTVSDGIGHIACGSATQLIWRDYSSLSTKAGRVLGWSASPFFTSGSWTPEVDATKPYNAGQLVIKQGATVIRTLAVPASTDGSLRGVSWDGTNDGGQQVGYGSFTAELVVASTDGTGAVKAVDGTSAPTFQVSRLAPGAFSALAPSRLLDTRPSQGGAGTVAAGAQIDLQVSGRGGVPLDGVGAVMLNVTVVDPKGAGYASVYPSGGTPPLSSNLNFVAGQVVPNLVLAKLGTGGKVTILNGSSGPTHFVVDVAGYYVAGSVTDPGGMTPLAPARLKDTRTWAGGSGPIAAYGSLEVPVWGQGGVLPSGVSAVVVNITAVDAKAMGYLTAYPTGGAAPTASNVNFTAGQTVPNLAVVKLSASGSFTIKNGSAGKVDVVVDVAGYVLAGTPTSSGMYVAVTPARILETRPAFGGAGPIAGNAVRSLAVTGVGGVPAGASGVVMNVTVDAGAGGGYLTVYPGDVATAPLASNLNFNPWQAVPNSVAVKTSPTGTVSIYNGTWSPTNVIVDISGYFTA